jgi:dipeptidyl aminopeptidase/acylaminoacyl peptidase
MGGVGCYADWSPDGRLLAFGGQGIDERTGLWILDVEKNHVVRVAGGQFTMPAWSADGSQLACTLHQRTGSGIWTVATKNLAALPPLAPATEHCTVPEAAAELVGPRHRPQGKLVCLDLRQHANRKLAEKLSPTADNDLKELPQGEQTFAGVKFRIADSAIQLASTRLSDAPRTVEGIPVQGRMNRLYILHSSQWGDAQFDVRDGTTIGRYEVCYADGGRATIPVVSGEDVRDWWSHTRDKSVTRGQVAWVGRNAAVRKSNLYLRLYLAAWENPHPEKIVASLDYVSTMTAAAPFCVAMTAEEPR